MGSETTCAVTLNGKCSNARVRLETNVLQIRGADLNVDVTFDEMKNVAARDGVLTIACNGSVLTVALGPSANKWVDKILHPPSRLAKLGVRANWRAAIVGDVDSGFVDELRTVVSTLSLGRLLKNADAVFVSLSSAADFKRLAGASAAIKPTGAVWIIRPKGDRGVSEAAVRAAGKAAGLVDVKVVGFSPTHSALKFVIPVKNRPY